jgi:hypothetical protein
MILSINIDDTIKSLNHLMFVTMKRDIFFGAFITLKYYLEELWLKKVITLRLTLLEFLTNQREH